ncbi:hypothetical protein EV646_116123 [Kribbella antiqua]|uniref:PIN domain-containing protein n=1 Tax=Kribbella antiqua TaxID=2512217 RepID=A0A4R2IAA7_9ACTN|nr:hypothetical protein [Kribbella antiqua]TCO41032.1 hypothetical protein EV646_116123 [Kribbella antiqua]
MYTVADLIADQAFGSEVFVADTDVLLGDACDALVTGQRSPLLRAVDAGSAIGLMSERAFREIGWMSASAARGRGVEHEALRALITDEYLPRVPVVVTPTADTDHWMPDATDIVDPDDVAHVQVARLVSARAIYSHDKHLRRPRLAPATRTDYDLRIVHLSVLSGRHESERGIGLVIGLTGVGATSIVSWTSVRLSVRPSMVWSGLALAAAASAYSVLAVPDRRQRIAERLKPLIERAGAAIERGDTARQALRDGRLIAAPETDRLEAWVAAHLVRNPDSTMGAIGEALDLDTAARRQLPALLRSHPSFELVSRYGWAVGRIRSELETQPSLSWKPRSSETR